MNLKNMIKLAFDWVKHNPQILITGLGIAASVATAITSGKAHAKAIVNDKGESKNLLDFAKRNWMTYVPAALSLGVTIFAFASLHKVSYKRYQALAAAYSVSQLDLSELRSRMAEQVKVLKEGASEKDKEVATKKLPESTMVIFGDEQVLCKDAITGRTFRSTPELLRKYCNNISEDLLNYGSCPLNDFYSQINLSQVGIGDELGWEGGKTIEPQFRPVILESGSPAIEVAITPAPQPNWFKIG
jgi:gp054